MDKREEKERRLLDILQDIGETLFKEVVFCLGDDEKLGKLPIEAYILGEEATLHERAESLVNEVKKIYPENDDDIKIIKEMVVNRLSFTKTMAMNI